MVIPSPYNFSSYLPHQVFGNTPTHFPFSFEVPNAGVFGHALGSGLKAGPVVAAACEYGCGLGDSVSCFVGPQCKSSSNRFRQWFLIYTYIYI